MIPQETVGLIFDKLDIVDIISEYVTLKKKGANHVGLSPFSNERTPSFVVSPAKNIFKDFSSGKGGNAINFLMELEKWTYPECLRWCATRYNIDIVEELSDNKVQEIARYESIYKINEYGCNHFQKRLTEDDEACAYLRNRMISEESIAEFRIGFAPPLREDLTNTALRDHYSREMLVASDLSVDGDNYLRDKFRHRIMFPIFSLSNRLAGFSGRYLGDDKNLAKYTNTKETEVFHKSSLLFGMNLAKKNIKKTVGCYLVEGQFDVVSMHQADIRNTVCTSGTALTKEQLTIMRRFTDYIIFLYDGDNAGLKAAARGLELALEEGFKVRVVPLPPGEDPHSFINNYGADEFRTYIADNTLDIVKFFFRDINNLSPEEQDEAKETIIRLIAKIPLSENFRIHSYVQELANHYNIPTDTIVNYLKRFRDTKQDEQVIFEREPETLQSDNAEIEFGRLLVKYGNLEFYPNNPVYFYLLDGCGAEKLKNPLIKKLIDIYFEFLHQDKVPNHDDLLKVPDPEICEFVTNNIIDNFQISSNWEGFEIICSPDYTKEVYNGYTNFHLYKINLDLEANRKALFNCSDEVEIRAILDDIKVLEAAQAKYAAKLGINIIT